MEWIYSLIFYGIMGLLIEVFFTGFKSLLERNWKASCQTYLWMAPVYSIAGLTIKLIHDNLHLTNSIYIDAILLAIFIYVPLFFGFELLSGLFLKKIIGCVPWSYGQGRYTPMGLINVKYTPFWFLLALFVHPIIIYTGKFFVLLDKMQ